MRLAHIRVSLPGIPTEKKRRLRKEMHRAGIWGTLDDLLYAGRSLLRICSSCLYTNMGKRNKCFVLNELAKSLT